MQVNSVVKQPRRTKVATSVDLSLDLRLSLLRVLSVLVERASVSKFGRDERWERSYPGDLGAVEAVQIHAPLLDSDLAGVGTEVDSSSNLLLEATRLEDEYFMLGAEGGGDSKAGYPRCVRGINISSSS